MDKVTPETLNIYASPFYNTATATGTGSAASITSTSTPSFTAILPQAKIGNGNFIYVFSPGCCSSGTTTNYFGISVPSVIITNENMTSSPGLTVMQAYSLDRKIDDGMATSGKVQAFYDSTAGAPVLAPNTNVSGGSATSCYDTVTNQYSTTQNAGAGLNCALSFQMQGAAR